jgi:SOS-response transcriptional repressor LexA
MSKKTRIPHKFLPWIEARKKHRLTHVQTQMARELGMNPKRLLATAQAEGKHKTTPLSEWIATAYAKRFGRQEPSQPMTIEEMAAAHLARRAMKKAAGQSPAATEGSPHDANAQSEDSNRDLLE